MKIPPRMRAGFTLAEVAATIVIVGLSLMYLLQGLTTAKINAGHTRYTKLARELGLMTLGQVESGLFQDDIANGLVGSYSEQGYDMVTYEVAVGDTSFHPKDANGAFDNWVKPPPDPSKKDDQQDTEQPYEKVKIRVTFPKLLEKVSNELILERWMPWKQVYGDTVDKDGKDKSGKAAAKTPPSSAGSASGSTSGSSTTNSGGASK